MDFDGHSDAYHSMMAEIRGENLGTLSDGTPIETFQVDIDAIFGEIGWSEDRFNQEIDRFVVDAQQSIDVILEDFDEDPDVLVMSDEVTYHYREAATRNYDLMSEEAYWLIQGWNLQANLQETERVNWQKEGF